MNKAFVLESTIDLSEYRSTGFLYRHLATGLEVFHVLNEDPENLFAFAFRTVPRDSRGTAHIVEHSVLCGSRRFPLKDAFISLNRATLATYLNALTYPDRTVYPASSTLESDYFNLMDVYGDAVFFPLLQKPIFLQEGVRLDPDAPGGPAWQGIVYSEMQGAYSSPEGILDDKAFTSISSRKSSSRVSPRVLLRPKSPSRKHFRSPSAWRWPTPRTARTARHPSWCPGSAAPPPTRWPPCPWKSSPRSSSGMTGAPWAAPSGNPAWAKTLPPRAGSPWKPGTSAFPADCAA